MPILKRKVIVLILLLLVPCSLLPPRSTAQQDESLALLEKSFASPPDDYRIMMRWWWFGPAVTKPELQRELEQMKAEGIGGVEIATLCPLALDDAKTGFHNQQFLSDAHLDAIRFAASTARKLGLRVDVTLGSGWPFGGPRIPVTEAAGELRVEMIPVPMGTDSIAVPDIATGEQASAFWQAPSSRRLAAKGSRDPGTTGASFPDSNSRTRSSRSRQSCS
jgi:alpha-L-rhamnosidase